MQDLITPRLTIRDGEARAASTDIARGVGLQHKNVLALIRRHQADLERFGGVAFETRAFSTRGGKQMREVGFLNEPQATLLMTLMRNSRQVVAFKVALVAEFYRMRTELGRSRQDLWNEMQALIAREVESKVRATFGSHLMLERKKEIPGLEAERLRLETEIQPSLLPH